MVNRNPNRLPAKILAFFEANPDEELTYADIAAKFGVSQASARWTVQVLLNDKANPLESVHVIRTKRKGMGLDG